MKYAVILENEGKRFALLKTDFQTGVDALALLCRYHIRKIYPECRVAISANMAVNLKLEMHPDKDEIMAKLRGYEFPLPKEEIVIEGECERV